jgi:hypothetical protein
MSLKNTQQSLGRKLPRALAQRLQENGGGSVAVIGENIDKEWILFPLQGQGDYDIVKATLADREEYGWEYPEGAISIGASESGLSLILMPGREQPHAFNPQDGSLLTVATVWKE